MKIQWNKITWYSKLVAVILAVIIFALGIYIGVVYQKGVDALEWSQQLRIDRPIPARKMVTQDREKQYEYVQEGNIKNNATGDVESDDWSLIYEKPGAPALTIGIIFMTSSRCVTDDRMEICNPATIEQGRRVRVMGYVDVAGKIIIERLEML